MTATAELTADQQQAADAFSTWLATPADGTPFVLSGFAGSGKTFLSMRLLRQVEATGLCWTVVAPTHKAVGVLRQALDLEGLQPTWYPSTIHRLLRLKLKRSGDVELCEPTEQTGMALENLGLVLIDEASMVDSTLLGIALQCAHPFKTRLVFVGDPAQLPPIREEQSPVFAMQRRSGAVLPPVVRPQRPALPLASRPRGGALAWLLVWMGRPPRSTRQGSPEASDGDKSQVAVRRQHALCWRGSARREAAERTRCGRARKQRIAAARRCARQSTCEK